MVPVVRVHKIHKHENADTLGVVVVFLPLEPGQIFKRRVQCVVKLGSMQDGDLAYYIPAGHYVPATPRFASLWPRRTLKNGSYVGFRERDIAVCCYRGQYSHGLLMKADSDTVEGQDAAKHLGVSAQANSILGWFYEKPKPQPRVAVGGRVCRVDPETGKLSVAA